MGGQAKDGGKSTQACVRSAGGMVSSESSSTADGTAPEAHAKALGPLRVLRDHRQRQPPPGIPGGRAKDMATGTVSAAPGQNNAVAGVPSAGEALPTSECTCGSRTAEPRSELMR